VVNVREMNAGVELVSQPFRDLNGLNRYAREIDRHQNISNAQFFHNLTMNSSIEINLSLLVKGNSFLAHKRSFMTSLCIIAWSAPLINISAHTGQIVSSRVAKEQLFLAGRSL
jgi:hypothetical protein